MAGSRWLATDGLPLLSASMPVRICARRATHRATPGPPLPARPAASYTSTSRSPLAGVSQACRVRGSGARRNAGVTQGRAGAMSMHMRPELTAQSGRAAHSGRATEAPHASGACGGSATSAIAAPDPSRCRAGRRADGTFAPRLKDRSSCSPSGLDDHHRVVAPRDAYDAGRELAADIFAVRTSAASR